MKAVQAAELNVGQAPAAPAAPAASAAAPAASAAAPAVALPALDHSSLLRAVGDLAARDPHLAAIAERFGPPPLWDRPAGFATLVHMILEQQVSLASAAAAFARLSAEVSPLTPAGFLALDDARLLTIGFSRQKAAYARGLAAALESGELELDSLNALTDEQVHRRLVGLKGIGPWTAGIYLLEVLLRPDIWPAADIALAQAVGEAKGLPRRPTAAELETIGDAWRPWRSVAARLFWHDYLTRRGRSL